MDLGPDLTAIGTVTSTTLLHGLKDPENRTIWREYVERYRPLLVRYSTKLGVPEAQAEDVAQSTLMSFSAAYREGKYDRAKGRLSSWLFGIAKNEVRSWARRSGSRPAESESALTSEVEALPADDELEERWECEWRETLLWECLKLIRREVKPETMKAFELFALEELPGEEVARRTGLSTNAIFGAKRRVLQRIRELMPLLEDTW